MMSKDAYILARSIVIASATFAGKTDRSGAPYILHLLFVMDQVRHLGYEAMSAAVLHDIIEDTSWTGDGLSKEGISDPVVSLVLVLTKGKDELYEDYIDRVSCNEIATEIKIAALRHNIDPLRLKRLSGKDHERINKYHTAYKYLSNVEAGRHA